MIFCKGESEIITCSQSGEKIITPIYCKLRMNCARYIFRKEDWRDGSFMFFKKAPYVLKTNKCEDFIDAKDIWKKFEINEKEKLFKVFWENTIRELEERIMNVLSDGYEIKKMNYIRGDGSHSIAVYFEKDGRFLKS